MSRTGSRRACLAAFPGEVEACWHCFSCKLEVRSGDLRYDGYIVDLVLTWFDRNHILCHQHGNNTMFCLIDETNFWKKTLVHGLMCFFFLSCSALLHCIFNMLLIHVLNCWNWNVPSFSLHSDSLCKKVQHPAFEPSGRTFNQPFGSHCQHDMLAQLCLS